MSGRSVRTDGPPTGGVVVRPARPGELAAVGALTLEAYRGDGFVHDEADYVAELLDTDARETAAELWVAADCTGAVLGTVTYCPVGSTFREVAVDDSEAEFRMLAVAAAARRRGVARLLVAAVLARARADGQVRVVLCSDRRMAAAHTLYAGMGFRRLPARDWAPVPHIELIAFGLEL